jgi:hypothetical protein
MHDANSPARTNEYMLDRDFLILQISHDPFFTWKENVVFCY